MVNGELCEENYINILSTIDHRFLDGATAAKIQKEVKFIFVVYLLNKLD
jgi:pyruvate/2-oxoglutarate dehydrogenase complex dihydrolipoamide acyltransferase (E2) component